jgi:uncharacterized protein with PIN domain
MDDEPIRLLVDGMLGTLAKWLRLLGYDTAYDNVASDAELARQARAEGRVLLTRDRELSKRRGLRTLLIESQVLEEQVREVQEHLSRAPPPPPPARGGGRVNLDFWRCFCPVSLHRRAIDSTLTL